MGAAGGATAAGASASESHDDGRVDETSVDDHDAVAADEPDRVQQEHEPVSDDGQVHALSQDEVTAGASDEPLPVEEQTPADGPLTADEVLEEHGAHDQQVGHDEHDAHDDQVSHDEAGDTEYPVGETSTYRAGDVGGSEPVVVEEDGHQETLGDDGVASYRDERDAEPTGADGSGAAAAGVAGAAGTAAAWQSTRTDEDRADHDHADHDHADHDDWAQAMDQPDDAVRADDAAYGQDTLPETGGTAPRTEGLHEDSTGYTDAPPPPAAHDDNDIDAPPPPAAHDDSYTDDGRPLATDDVDAPPASTGEVTYAERTAAGGDEGYVDQATTDTSYAAETGAAAGAARTADTGSADERYADERYAEDSTPADAPVSAEPTAASGTDVGAPVFAESIYGTGSAEPLEDGTGPAGWEVKGNAGSMLFHTPDSPSYDGVRAEVWFESEEAARAAGFAHWDRRRR